MKNIIGYLILAIPFGVVWVILTNHISIESYLIGYAMGLLTVVLGVQTDAIEVNMNRLPQRIFTFFVYSVFMLWQVAVSGWDVTLRILGIRPIKPGIIALEIGDETNNEYISGASAHSITITPGEMVVEYDRDCRVMYIHCIDAEQSQKTLQSAQAHRLSFFRRIIGS